MFVIVNSGKCDVCSKSNSELVVLDKKIFGIVKVEIKVCQTCVSNMFRQFKAGL